MSARASQPPVRFAVTAFIIDLLLVTVFAALGRNSHAREASALGLLETAWPFLVGIVIMWFVTLAWRAPVQVFRTGVPVWSGTVLIGMLLRALTGGGTAIPFVIVTVLVLGAFLLGWRALALLVIRGRAGR